MTQLTSELLLYEQSTLFVSLFPCLFRICVSIFHWQLIRLEEFVKLEARSGNASEKNEQKVNNHNQALHYKKLQLAWFDVAEFYKLHTSSASCYIITHELLNINNTSFAFF